MAAAAVPSSSVAMAAASDGMALKHLAMAEGEKRRGREGKERADGRKRVDKMRRRGTHGFVEWHDDPTSAFLRVWLGDLRDRVWMLENEAAAMCKDEDAGAGAVCVEARKRNEQTSSTSYSLARKGLMLVCAIVIFVSGLVLGMLLS
ncbi:hypothetical protein ZWY2020_031363 [Hordeum vulgare]|nr:hypothetical protein ZWY2020_031363 [Hordeum vulgare]